MVAAPASTSKALSCSIAFLPLRHHLQTRHLRACGIVASILSLACSSTPLAWRRRPTPPEMYKFT
eukprot:7018463-Prymnesium_polylepis.3